MKMLMTRCVTTVLICNNCPSNSIAFMSAVSSTSGRLLCELVRILFLQAHRETDLFFAASGVEHAQHKQDQFRFRCPAFYSQFKSKVGNILGKDTVLCINLNMMTPLELHTHTGTHPSHSQTSRLLFTSLSLGTPLPPLHLSVCEASPSSSFSSLSLTTPTPFYIFPHSSPFIR